MGTSFNEKLQKNQRVPSTPSQAVIQSLIQDAVRSPSGDNAQPWKFHWDGQKLQIYHLENMAAHTLNRSNHASMIALGAVLESLRISATRFGLTLQTKTSSQTQGNISLWAEVTFYSSVSLNVSPLSVHISRRATDRRVYHGGEITAEMLQQIQAMEADFPGCHVRVQSKHTLSFVNYFLKTEEMLWKNSKIVRDLTKWMRLSSKEIKSSQDGMSWKNMNMQFMDAMVFHLVRRYPIIPKILWSLGFGMKIKAMSKEAIRSSAALICFSVDKLDADSFCKVGQLAMRVWLFLNANNMGVQPLSYSSSSIADCVAGAFSSDDQKEEREMFHAGKAVLREHFGLEQEEIPVWTFRTGLSTMMTKERRTPRRDTETFFLSQVPAVIEKRDQRIEISFAVKTQSGESLQTANISKNGLRTISREGAFQQDGQMDLFVQIEEKSIQLRVQSIWLKNQFGESHRGFQILNAPQEWQHIVSELEAQKQITV